MDKMREEFEEWAISCDMCTYFDDVEYRHQSTEWAWKAWQASRAALCVELPQGLSEKEFMKIANQLTSAGVDWS